MKPTPELLDRLPPHDLDAERGALGSLLLDPSRIRDVAGVVAPSDFYADGHRRICQNLYDMDGAGEKVDALLLAARLRAAKELEAAGGPVAIAECMQSVPVATHAIHYARIVAKKAAARRNIQAACNLLTASYGEDDDPATIAATAIKALQEGLDSSGDDGPQSMLTAAVEAFERIEQVAERQQGFGLPTGLEAYDEAHGGFFPGELIVIAARPSVGKTSLALQVAWYCGLNRRGVYFASAEMSAVELAGRVICGQANVSSRKVRTGALATEDVAQLSTSAQPLGEMPWWVDDHARLTTTRIRRCCRKLAAKDELRLVVVDYLQRLTPEDRKLARHEQIGQQVRDLKSLAVELQVPVLCLVQLNRESRKDTRPRLHHLGDSGEIEREADVVGFLHEPEHKRERAPDNPNAIDVDLSVDKNRNGEVGRIELEFIRPRTLFACAGRRIETHNEFDAYSGEF
uniref:DNA 5'-3' helicase n=1 Tax=viral metagenome TaxID=1070528 RepID=A0A6M3L536_9ZZZZ